MKKPSSTIKLEEEVRRAGLSLPPSARAAQIKAELLSQVEALRAMAIAEAGGAENGAATEKVVIPPRRRLITWPRVATAAVIILALLVGLGIASTYAMPGNPLYSVKRFLEDARAAFTPGGESEADLSLSHAQRRLDELRYAQEKEMSGWYASLARDVVMEIHAALNESAALPEEKAAEIRSSALALLERLLPQLKGVMPQLPAGQAETLRQDLEDTLQELDGVVPPPWEDTWDWPKEGEPGKGVPPVPHPQTPREPPRPREKIPRLDGPRVLPVRRLRLDG